MDKTSWWKGADKLIYVYNTQLKIKFKSGVSVMCKYYDNYKNSLLEKKEIAHQYRVEKDSLEHKELVSKLKLNKKNEDKV